MSLTVVLDHAALVALYRADEYVTGLCVEARHGRGRIVVPGLSIVEAEHIATGAGTLAAGLPYAAKAPFTITHARDALTWPRSAQPVLHPAALWWQAVADGEDYHILSSAHELYEGTGVTPLHPQA